jgi:small-conductance mechanosensitive channel
MLKWTEVMDQEIRDFLTSEWIIKIIFVLITFILIKLAASLFKKSATRYVKDNSARYRIRKFITIMGYLLALFAMALIFKDRLSGLSVFFGLAGAGVALALNEVVLSLGGGVAIAVGNFYATGDRVKIGGITGDVIDIGLLRTTLMECGEWIKADLPTGRLVTVANSLIFKEPIFNYSTDFPFLWDEITLPVKYGSDHQLARDLFARVLTQVVGSYTDFAKRAWKEVVKKFFIEEAMIEPVITLAFNDNWIELTGRYITDYRKRRDTKNKIFSLLLQEIDQTQGRVSIASTTLELVNPTLHIEVRDLEPPQKDS